jgi:RNA polymerase sigma factor (TIGR02999 family)
MGTGVLVEVQYASASSTLPAVILMPPPEDIDLTQLLVRATGGGREALDAVFPVVYDELKELARAKLRMEREGHTLNATGLVHEAYLKLADQDRVTWQSRVHFFAVASLAMRRILVSYARSRKTGKRAGRSASLPLASAEHLATGDVFGEEEADDLLALDEALERLGSFNPKGADVVQYRFFGGLAHREIAEVMGVSEVTVRRRWAAAKAWLRSELDPAVVAHTGTLLAGAPPS